MSNQYATNLDSIYDPGTNTTEIRQNGQTVAKITGNQLMNQYNSYTTGTTYTPTSLGMTTYLSSGTFGTLTGYPVWTAQASPPPPAPYKGQVINWGGKVYYQPSDKMRTLVDALRLV